MIPEGVMKFLSRLALMLALTSPLYAQTPALPALDTNTTFARTNAFNGATIFTSNCFKGPRRWLDVTCYGASGSSEFTTANCVSGLPSLTLASTIDFVNGEGLSILGCGAAPTVTVPTVNVANIGTAGSTTYSYAVATVDAGGGNSGYGTLVSTTTGNATLSGTNYNAIYIAPVSGARGYALVGRSSGSPTVLQYMPWEDPTSYTGSTASRTSNYVTVSVPGVGATLSFFPTWFVTLSGCSDSSFNGTFQVNSTGQNTFTYNQTASNSTATGCTVTVDPTFFDFGTAYPLPNDLNVSSSTTNDIFVAAITSGAGTTSVNLSASPNVTATGQTVRHDDTAAWKAAISEAATLNNATPIYCPAGQYEISSDLDIANGFNLQGAGYGIIVPSCQIRQQSPGADIFRGGYPSEAGGVKISNALLTGGRIGIDSVLPGGLSLEAEGVMLQSYIGFRASANSIQITLRTLYCQTADWCIDSSPAATIQGFKIDTGWFGGTGFGIWHDVRIPNTFGSSTGVSFNDCVWEGPTGSWMVSSATPVGARNIFASVTGLIINNGQLADSGMSNVNFIQTLPSTNGGPPSIEFNGGDFVADANAYLVFVESNGATYGPNLIFNGGSYTAGVGIWGAAGPSNPSVVVNNGGSFSPTLPTTNLVNSNNGRLTSSLFGTTTNCSSNASPAAC